MSDRLTRISLRRLALAALGATLWFSLAGCKRAQDEAGAGLSGAGEQVAGQQQPNQPAMGQQPGQMPAAIDDANLIAAVKTALVQEKDLQALAINVDSKNGAVVLTGQVKTMADKERAQRVASTVTGVASVDNQLQISG